MADHDDPADVDEARISTLCSHGEHNVLIELPKGSGRDYVVEKCKELFPVRENFFIQYWSEEWNAWLDFPQDLTITTRMRLKIIEPSAASTSSKRSATGSLSGSSDEEKEKSPKLAQLLQAVREKLPKYVAKKKRHGKIPTVNITLGWMHYINTRYSQVRKHTAGKGSIQLTINRNATYKEIITEGKELFFQNGTSRFGKARHMECHLVTFGGKVIEEDGFELSDFLKTGEKCRLYFGTKKVVEASDTESDDSELPDPHIQGLEREVGSSESEAEHAQHVQIHKVQEVQEPQEAQEVQEAHAEVQEPQEPQEIQEPQAQKVQQPQEAQGVQPQPAVQFTNAGTPTVRMKSTMCPVCLDKMASHFIVPCGHTFCKLCCGKLYGSPNPCPLCRGNIDGICPLVWQ